MSTPKDHLLEAMTANDQAGVVLARIHRHAAHGNKIPATDFTTARLEIQRSLNAVNALELLAKGFQPPQQG